MESLFRRKRKRETDSIPRDGEEDTSNNKRQRTVDNTENVKTEKDTGGDVDVIEEKCPKEKDNIQWKEIRAENLNVDYCILYSKLQADEVLRDCEELLNYNDGQLAKVKVFGKWHDIPRQQVAHGDQGLSYSFSNTTVPARPWIPMLQRIRDKITEATGFQFNFVLINKYRDGKDHIGEHRDDEKDLVPGHPIASLSLGQTRDFIFKHADTRGKCAKRKIKPVQLELKHGSLLMMKYPTNTFWYHSLPQRKQLSHARINMTFRKMIIKPGL